MNRTTHPAPVNQRLFLHPRLTNRRGEHRHFRRSCLFGPPPVSSVRILTSPPSADHFYPRPPSRPAPSTCPIVSHRPTAPTVGLGSRVAAAGSMSACRGDRHDRRAAVAAPAPFLAATRHARRGGWSGRQRGREEVPPRPGSRVTTVGSRPDPGGDVCFGRWRGLT